MPIMPYYGVHFRQYAQGMWINYNNNNNYYNNIIIIIIL